MEWARGSLFSRETGTLLFNPDFELRRGLKCRFAAVRIKVVVLAYVGSIRQKNVWQPTPIECTVLCGRCGRVVRRFSLLITPDY